MSTENQKEQIEMQEKMISDVLDKIKHRIVVFSGKGGVGKTTVSVNLAYALQSKGNKTGLLDADITGPNVPKMLGLSGQIYSHHNRLIPQESHNLKVISIANIIQSDQPVIWRGPLRSRLLCQFLGEVEWGQLDYLVADLPPGTGDEILTITEKMEPDLAIIVTTPQEVSLVDSARAINMAKKMNVRSIGVVENMSGLLCPKCGTRIELFGSGGGRRQAAELNVSFLGILPIDMEARKMADQGKLIIHENTQAHLSTAIWEIVKVIENVFYDNNEVPGSRELQSFDKMDACSKRDL